MKIKNFEDLEIWKGSKEIAVKIFKITNNIRFKYDLGFKDQIRRSAISMPSNISEGFERNNNNEFIYFLKIAKGSSSELITQLKIAYETGFLLEKEANYFIERLKIINSKIGKLIIYLLKNKV